MEHAYFPLLKLKMWFFVQECAAELPFLSSVKIIFQKFRFFLQILSPIWLGAILCAHAILCAPTVHTFISHSSNTYIHRHSLGPLSISSLLESSVGRPSLWCRAENRTRACLTASWCATNSATPHHQFSIYCSDVTIPSLFRWTWQTALFAILFYVTEGNIMYLTDGCWFLISCVIQHYAPVVGWGVGRNRFIMLIMTLDLGDKH